MWFETKNQVDYHYLSQFNVWGGIPQEPICLPGIGRYGRYQFNEDILLQRSDLTVAQKKEVIFLCEHFHKVDHFEFFALKASTHIKSIKKAYFRFSKRFHPDSLKDKNLGMLHQHVPLLFQYGQYIYQLLSEDEQFLEIYTRVTQERDQEFRAKLERERQALHHQVKLKQKQQKDPIHSHQKRSKEKINQRKEYLRARLNQNQQKRSQVSKQEQNEQASKFHIEGLQAESRQQWTRAYNHFKLAADYMPHVSEYRDSLSRIRVILADQKAQVLWESAQPWIDIEQLDKSLPIHQQSLELSLNAYRIIQFYQYYHKTEVALCSAWLTKACEKWIHNLDLKWAYIQILIQDSNFKHAISIAEEILSFDPSEPRALKFMKQYKYT
jgi:hypothetical protein